MKFNMFKKLTLVFSLAIFAAVSLAQAGGKTYSEDEFLSSFSGKSKKEITEALGKPAKTQMSVKPTNANAVVGRDLDDKNSKPVNVEMWYYKHVVRYDNKNTYTETEITFVNDRAMNIAFFNNR